MGGGSLTSFYRFNNSGYILYDLKEVRDIKSFLYDINGFLRNPVTVAVFNDMCLKFGIKSLYLDKSFKQSPLSFKNALQAGLVDSQSKSLFKLNNNTWELYLIVTFFKYGYIGYYCPSTVKGISI